MKASLIVYEEWVREVIALAESQNGTPNLYGKAARWWDRLGGRSVRHHELSYDGVMLPVVAVQQLAVWYKPSAWAEPLKWSDDGRGIWRFV